MSTSKGDQRHANRLRQRAEEALRGNPVEVADLHPEDIQFLLHELQVHQTELSIQNEELRRIQEELETARDQYSNLYNFAPAGYCTLSRKDHILKANQTLADMLGVRQAEIIHHKLSDFVNRDDQDKYYLHRRHVVEGHQRQISNVCMVKQDGEKIIVRLESMIAHEDETKIWVMLSDITQQQQIEKEAQEAAALRELQKRLNDQREQERLRVARDLHDGPIQGLVATTFALHEMISENSNPELTEPLKAILADVKKEISELRACAIELRPPMIANFGLEKTFYSYADTFQNRNPGFTIQFEMHPIESLLPEATGLALFRIYQEALTNIAKHVKCPDTRIIVRLDQDEEQVRLEIQDNGQGFEIPEQWIDLIWKGHLGLVGMRERAEAVGGQIEIHSKNGGGTRVTVSVPMKKEKMVGDE